MKLKNIESLPKLLELLGTFLYDSTKNCVFVIQEVIHTNRVGCDFYDLDTKEKSYRYLGYGRVLKADGEFKDIVSLATAEQLETLADSEWRDTGNHGEKFNPNYQPLVPLATTADILTVQHDALMLASNFSTAVNKLVKVFAKVSGAKPGQRVAEALTEANTVIEEVLEHNKVLGTLLERATQANTKLERFLASLEKVPQIEIQPDL